MNRELFETIAKVIGYHFWQVKDDYKAIQCGKDCAKEIVEELEKEGLLRENADGKKV